MNSAGRRLTAKGRMADDDPFEPGAAPEITAPVNSDLKQPGLFLPGFKLGTAGEQPDKYILSNVFSLLPVSQIVVGDAKNIGGISVVQAGKIRRDGRTH